MRPRPILFLWAALAATLLGTPPGIDQDLECVTDEDGVPYLRWFAVAGRSYFIEASDSGDLLQTWLFLPVIEGGSNTAISHQFEDPVPETAFYRLKYTDRVPGPLETLDSADFDDDGLTNQVEVELGAYRTDPLKRDTDGDALPDGWEVANDLDPTDPDGDNGASGDPDQNGIANLEEYRAGDSDGDGLSNYYEESHTTNPFNADTDHDGIPDNEDDPSNTPNHSAIYSAQSVTVWSPRQ